MKNATKKIQAQQALHLEQLIEKVSAAVKLGDVAKVTRRIKDDLEDLICHGQIEIPSHLIKPNSECYARRLLHRDKELGFIMVLMTWGPGQGTPIHDHSGIWCVEGVVQGKMDVTSFKVAEKNGDRFRFIETEKIKAGVGGAGALIPPYEHHILANALTDRPSVTLHVYGGEINQCSAFVDAGNGWHKRELKNLVYHQ